MDNVEIINGNHDISMKEGTKDEDRSKMLKLQDEFTKFLNTHTVYETIPENMKVCIILFLNFIFLFENF
jgi:metallophosphoesterase superfamily enzyme